MGMGSGTDMGEGQTLGHLFHLAPATHLSTHTCINFFPGAKHLLAKDSDCISCLEIFSNMRPTAGWKWN